MHFSSTSVLSFLIGLYGVTAANTTTPTQSNTTTPTQSDPQTVLPPEHAWPGHYLFNLTGFTDKHVSIWLNTSESASFSLYKATFHKKEGGYVLVKVHDVRQLKDGEIVTYPFEIDTFAISFPIHLPNPIVVDKPLTYELQVKNFTETGVPVWGKMSKIQRTDRGEQDPQDDQEFIDF